MSHSIEANQQTPSHAIDESNSRCTEMDCSVPGSYMVPTVFKKDPKQINLIDLRVSDLFNLKEEDPFLYYSIPAVRKASMHGIRFDESSLDTSLSSRYSSSPLRRSISFNSYDSHGEVDSDDKSADMEIEMQEKLIAVCGLTRQSRLSFESPDLPVLDQPCCCYSDDENDDYEEFMLSFLESCTK
ncbi:hypothetical protein ACHAWX_000512 [Stephanocyclus meneghinianus]